MGEGCQGVKGPSKLREKRGRLLAVTLDDNVTDKGAANDLASRSAFDGCSGAVEVDGLWREGRGWWRG